MFTGIVEAIGTVESLTTTPTGTTLTISTPPPSPILADIHEGDSISVLGVCLTATSFTPTTFTVGLAPETLRRTNLGRLSEGCQVNLERAVGQGVRFGGHYVQGHVDCIAGIAKVETDGEARRMRFAPAGEGSKGIMKYIVEKGFVCVDGASLTVTKVGRGRGYGSTEGGDGDGDGNAEGWFEVMLVPYSQEKLVTGKKGVDETVNIEVDLMGKLIEKQIEAHLEAGGLNRAIEAMMERIVERKLKEAGVLK